MEVGDFTDVSMEEESFLKKYKIHIGGGAAALAVVAAVLLVRMRKKKKARQEEDDLGDEIS